MEYTATAPLWPEIFGVGHLGAIRAVATAAIVGVLLDAGVPLETQFLAMALYAEKAY